jgi:hypothetical protein
LFPTYTNVTRYVGNDPCRPNASYKRNLTRTSLFAHRNGQWAKIIQGNLHYFGTDQEAALSKYEKERDDLQAGRTPRVQADCLTLRELVNRFLTHKKVRMQEGELTPRTFRDYYDTCERLLVEVGKEKPFEVIHSDDFEQLRMVLSRKRGPVALANEI